MKTLVGRCELLSQLQKRKVGGLTKCLPKKVPPGCGIRDALMVASPPPARKPPSKLGSYNGTRTISPKQHPTVGAPLASTQVPIW